MFENKYLWIGHKLAHRVIMERYLERKLETREVVHHKNGLKFDNSINNLEIKFNEDHSRHHSKKVELVKINCNFCDKEIELLPSMFRYKNKKQKMFYCSKKCVGFNSKKYLQHNKINHELIISEYNNGISGYKISEKYGLNRTTVYNTIRSYTNKNNMVFKHLHPHVDNELIINEFKNGLIGNEISRKHNLNRSTVYSRIKKYINNIHK